MTTQLIAETEGNTWKNFPKIMISSQERDASFS